MDNGILTLREAATILKIESPNYDPLRKVRQFLLKIEKQRNTKILFRSSENGNYYTTVSALKDAIPEAFEPIVFDKENVQIREDISEDTFEIVKDLVNDLKDDMNALRLKNNNMQTQIQNLSSKYNDLEFKYNLLKSKKVDQ